VSRLEKEKKTRKQNRGNFISLITHHNTFEGDIESFIEALPRHIKELPRGRYFS